MSQNETDRQCDAAPVSSATGAADEADSAAHDEPNPKDPTTDDAPQIVAPYAEAATELLASGLGSPLPLPHGKKYPPPPGWSGAEAPHVSGADVAAWTEDRGASNVGIRVAHNVIGIDRDDHKGDDAAETLATFESEYGALPHTWRSSARDDGAGGVYWFRLPEGATTSDDLADIGPGVELVRQGHRYAVCPPSVHPSGSRYVWFDPSGCRVDAPPQRDELPVLTARHVDGLRSIYRAPAESRETSGTGIAYDELDERVRARVDAFLNAKVDALRGELADAATWPEGRVDDRGRGWQKLVADAACSLGRAARAPWTPWSLEHAEQMFLDVVPDVVKSADRIDVARAWRTQRERRVPLPEPSWLGDAIAEAEADAEAEHALSACGFEPSTAASVGDGALAGEVVPGGQVSMAVRVYRWAAAHFDVGCTPDNTPYVVAKDGPGVALPIGGHLLDAAARRAMYAATGRAATREAVATGLGLLEADAYEVTQRRELHLRVADLGDRIVLDLAQPASSRCAVVSAAGWNVAERPPEGVVFRRPPVQRPLPTPVGSGSLEPLRTTLGFAPDDNRWQLVRGWLPAALRCNYPRPLLIFTGAAGSGKTSRGRAVVNILDPRAELGSSFGRNLDDDRAKALNSFLVGFDNVTSISEAVSDQICRLVTGDASEKRKQYTDTDVVSMSFKRTGVLTAINLPALRPDALERAIPIHLDPTPVGARKSEAEMSAKFEDAHPGMLGAVLDDAVTMLRNLSQSNRDFGVRHMDYAISLASIDPALMDAYRGSAEEILVTAAEDDPFVVHVRNWLASIGGGDHKGSPADCFASLKVFLHGRMTTGEEWVPRDAASMSRALTKAAGPLRAVGVNFAVARSGRARTWVFNYTSEGDL